MYVTRSPSVTTGPFPGHALWKAPAQLFSRGGQGETCPVEVVGRPNGARPTEIADDAGAGPVH